MRWRLRTLSAILALSVLSVLSACDTVEGMAKDIKSAGGAIRDTGSER